VAENRSNRGNRGKGAGKGRLDLDSPGFKHKLLATIIQNTPAAYILIDGSYRVRFVNDYLFRLRRLRREDVVGRVCYDAFNGGVPCPRCVIKRAMEDGSGHRVRRKDTLLDGSVVYTDDLAVPVKTGGGESMVLDVLTDRTVEMRLKEKAGAMFLGVVHSMIKILEKKDPYTCAHSRDVSTISAKLTKYMGLDDRAIFNATLGGLLHDLGKLHVPDALLNKRGGLEAWEVDMLREHPIFTYLLLPDLESFKTIREIAISHHEKWDGTGYPNALAGEDIPVEARIAAVADTYSAMTSDRPYRKGLGHDVAMAEIKKCAGTQFDPRIVEKFVKMVEDGSLDKGSLTAQDDARDPARDPARAPAPDRHVQRRISTAAAPLPLRGAGDDAGVLAASDSLIEAIFDNTPALYMIIDESFNVLFASDSLLLAKGIPGREIYSQKCFDALDRGGMRCFQSENGCIRCPAVRAFASGREEYGLIEETIEGRAYYYGVYAVPMELDDVDGNKIRCCLEIMLDQTKEKRAQVGFEGDLRRIVEALCSLIAELDPEATSNIEEISGEAVGFTDYLNRMQDELAEMLGPHGTG
jgi:HD-GYP domain-containing protein (c-di-GMP phosphodiesterase class II)